MQVKATILAGALSAALVQTASAQQAVDFPADPSSRPGVEHWINQNLDLTGFTATGWSSNALFFTSIRDLDLSSYPAVRTLIWVEIINPEAARARGWRSSVSKIEFDCETRRYRELSHDDYAGAGRRGEARSAASAGTWRTADPDTTMASTIDEVCYRAKSAVDVYANGLRGKLK